MALHTAFQSPIEDLLADGVADGTLRPVDDPGADAARTASTICDLLLDGPAAAVTR